MLVQQIITGGQTGVDRAAMDAALARGIPLGGWCPRGRRAEDGVIDAKYPLKETPSDSYPERTRWNARDADGVLILTRGAPSGGTRLGLEYAQSLHKPVHVVDLDGAANVGGVQAFIAAHGIQKLGVGGPRESQNPGIYQAAMKFLTALFAA